MKILKVLLIVLSILFGIILGLPLIFKSQLMELAKVEVNKAVKAQVDWSDFKVSLFKGFPDLKISLENMSVLGIENFENDTLMAFDEFIVKVDLLSAFSGKIKVKSIILNKPVIRAISLEEGVNWDISYPSEEKEEVEVDTTSSDMEMTISLNEFLIKNAEISYYDEVSSTFASIEDYNLILSGDFSESITSLDLNTFAESITVDYDGTKYLNKSTFSLKVLLNADLENMVFEISDNLLEINDLGLGLEGTVGLPENADADVDIRFFTKETSFKTLLSMVPAIYMADFAELKTSGKLEIEGTAKGLVKGEILPQVNLNLMVNDGYFAYPDLPEAVENISIDLQVFYDGIDDDNTSIDLNNFHMELAGNPIDMNFHARTPMSDMQMNGKLVSEIDLASLKNAIPVDNMELQGNIVSDIEFMGKMSDIENENYEDFKADGLLEISDMIVEGEDLPVPVNLQKLRLLFSPQFVNLETLDVKL
ncbi:MAG: AsmA family protein, partial [Bacteroidales bacterium]|nr:AsmA family protein [Bacteroidales bacterium]